MIVGRITFGAKEMLGSDWPEQTALLLTDEDMKTMGCLNCPSQEIRVAGLFCSMSCRTKWHGRSPGTLTDALSDAAPDAS